MEAIENIVTIIKRYERFLLVIHENPDGDTIATTLGLQEALMGLGKSVVCVCKDEVPKPFLFLPGTQHIRQNFLVGDYDVIIVLDCGDLRRTGFAERLKAFAKHTKRLINIDHHPKNDLHKVANINLFDETAASVAEVVYNLLRIMHVPLNKNIATCFLTALYTDTGGFKHSNTSPRSLEYAAVWMASGAKLKLITKNISLNRSVAALRLWGVALSRIKKNSLGLVTSVVTRSDMENNGAIDGDLGGIVNMINSIPGAKAAALLTETEDGKIRVSLRTETDGIDVSKLAVVFGGGGHKKASGFTITGKLKVRHNGSWEVEGTKLNLE